MRMWNRILPLFVLLSAAFRVPTAAFAQSIPRAAAIDGEVNKIMTQTNAKGMAVAVIDHG
jgi:hypothetical protein